MMQYEKDVLKASGTIFVMFWVAIAYFIWMWF